MYELYFALSAAVAVSCAEQNILVQIPVFRGCGGPLVGANNLLATDHFGTDGLGDVIKDRDPQWEQKIQREHAANAMIRLVTENQNQVRNLYVKCGCSRLLGY